VTFNRVIVLFLLLMWSAWAALINDQPFFMADSSAYIRGPDFATVYFLGPKFATSWTQERTLQGINYLKQHQIHEKVAAPTSEDVRLNSPFDKAVMGGRSIYYGALLYLGHLTSYLWLVVFVQAAIFLYLSYTLAIKCLRLSFFTFVNITSTILIATPLTFFISFMMPDVFASFLIVGLATLIGFWDSLRGRDQLILFAIVLYSAVTHTSHLLLLIGLGSIFALMFVFKERNLAFLGSHGRRLIILLALMLTSVLGQFAFSYGTRYTIGVVPLQPPFAMARLIADGPGYQFLRKHCATKPYVVCRYLKRLPTPSDTFLWSNDPKEGIYNVADIRTRTALSSEQTRFVIDVLRFDPIGVITTATNNFIRQFLMIGLDELFLNTQRLDSFEARLPAHYFAGMLHSRLALRDWILGLLNSWYSVIYYLSMFTFILVWAVGSWVRFPNKSDIFPQPEWTYLLTITAAGIIINAAICGILSEPASRYQTRVAWIPLFVLCLILGSVWETLSSVQKRPQFTRQLAERVPRSLRFLGIGGIGLVTDLGVFTVIAELGTPVLVARLGSLVVATMVTWRLNRVLTFDPSGRSEHEEAVRYAIVTVIAQGTSYAIFAGLVLTSVITIPQVSIVVGAAIGAFLSYNGHRLLSFAPKSIYLPQRY
jgi:putative flippase GtrA